MWRAAMLYYTVVRASDLSFSALFHDLAKFAREPAVRWDYCLRAKRGLSDTSEPGKGAERGLIVNVVGIGREYFTIHQGWIKM